MNRKTKTSISSIFSYFPTAMLVCLALQTRGWAGPNLEGYDLAFSDEFDQLTLDSSKWNTGYLWGPYLSINSEEQFYVDTLGINSTSLVENGGQTPNPFELTGYSLKINAIPSSDQLDEAIAQVPQKPSQDDPVWDEYPEYRFNNLFDPSTVDYFSGVITSYDAFRFTHGYAEARLKFPEQSGVWPAFWLLNSFYVEDSPELDIVEFIGGENDKIFHTYHYFEPENNWNKVSTDSFETIANDLTDDWVTVGAAWGSDSIIWYVNGIETYRISSTDYDIPNQAMYLIANMAVGGSWPESLGRSPVKENFPASYEIDYIRVYEKKPPSAITPASLEQDYEIVFSDEFSELGLDSSKWNTSFLWGPYYRINDENQFYPDMTGAHSTFSPNPIEVSNGTLKLTAHFISDSTLPIQPDSDGIEFTQNKSWQYNPNFDNSTSDDPFLPKYISGLVTTYDSFKFVNGYAEIRAKLPSGDGLWPAFWLLNGYYVDQQPEIDVMEFRGESPSEVVHSYHYYKDGVLQSPVSEITDHPNSDYDFANGEFYTFGIAWNPGMLDWYVNGEKVLSYASEEVSSQVAYAILNMAVDGNFNFAQADSSNFPKTYEIDYIRIYQLLNSAASTASNLQPAITLPENNSILTDSNTTFTWDPADLTPSTWSLWVGSTPGTYDIAAVSKTGDSTSHTFSNLPTDGSTLYVRFWSNDNGWKVVDDYQYTTSSGL